MASLVHWVRDNFLYSSGYVSGRYVSLPRSFTEIYVSTVTTFTKLIALPLPFLSFLALPFFTGTSTTISIAFFYLTWSALVLSHSQLTVELYGTLAVRLLCFVLPALGFVLLDSGAPKLSRGIKNRGSSQLPLLQLGRRKLLEVVGVGLFNVALSIALQALIELVTTEVLHLRSILRVTTIVPLPWNIIKDVLSGFVLRGILIYVVHRFVLHTIDSPLKTWHLEWQHSVSLPFSIVAADDHPVNYLLGQWLPVFLPALVFRFHVLTWHFFLALCSLEELFVYSGYAVLPSRIILLGMARRNDEHFACVADGQATGNFGRTGILDFVCGTTCSGEDDALDDFQAEAEKHQVKERAQDAKDGAIAGLKGRQRAKGGGRGQSKKK